MLRRRAFVPPLSSDSPVVQNSLASVVSLCRRGENRFLSPDMPILRHRALGSCLDVGGRSADASGIGYVGHRWGVYQTQQNAFQGGYFRSEESDIQSLITAMRMIPGGQSAWDILHHHPGYAAGWAAIDAVGLAGGELATHGTALLRGSRLGERIAGAAKWAQLWFYDEREFPTISRAHWVRRGPAAGRSLHHWLLPQRWKWVPVGFRNAGFNLLELPELRGLAHPRLSPNAYMGFAPRWSDPVEAFKARPWEWGIRGLIPGGAAAGTYGGYRAGEWLNEQRMTEPQK